MDDQNGIRTDLALIYEKISKIERVADKIQSINLATMIAVVLLGLILWRLW
jgi:hypothetical protein